MRRLHVTWSSLLARRERKRRNMMMSTNRFIGRLAGRLNEGDRRDLRNLHKASADSQEDIVKSMNCLREATVFMDDVIHNPKVVRNLRYRMWVKTLDSFLTEMRSMVSYTTVPGNYEVDMSTCHYTTLHYEEQYQTDILELLIEKLSMLRIREVNCEQAAVRTNLEMMIESVFTLNMTQRIKLFEHSVWL